MALYFSKGIFAVAVGGRVICWLAFLCGSTRDFRSPGKKKPPGHKAQEVSVSTGWCSPK